MTDERYYSMTYKKTGEVTTNECYIGNHNCASCMHCRDHNGQFKYFEHSYCLKAKK